jgi:hypothetical protein
MQEPQRQRRVWVAKSASSKRTLAKSRGWIVLLAGIQMLQKHYHVPSVEQVNLRPTCAHRRVRSARAAIFPSARQGHVFSVQLANLRPLMQEHRRVQLAQAANFPRLEH